MNPTTLTNQGITRWGYWRMKEGDEKMNRNFELSSKSKTFLENLRIYLFSSGKRATEIDEIVEELELHLIKAEQKGKSIENIIGKSPKDYMEMIANEMSIDFRTWSKYIAIIIFGIFSFSIFQDLTEGPLAYSIMEIIGHIVVGTISIIILFAGFRYIGKNSLTNVREWVIILPIALLPMAMFLGLIYLNRMIETPVIYFGKTGSLIIAIISALFIIGLSIWAKTWVVPILLALITLPDYLLGFTTLNTETQLTVSAIITFVGIAIYLWLTFQKSKE